MASTRTISTRGRLTIALTPISIVLVASGPSLAHLGLVPPISGFNVFLTGLGLGVVAFVLGLSSLLGERKKKNLRRGWTAITSVLAFSVTILLLTVSITKGFRTTPKDCDSFPSCLLAGVDAFYAIAYRPGEFASDVSKEFSFLTDISTNTGSPPVFSVGPRRGGDWNFSEKKIERHEFAYPETTTFFAGGVPAENFPIVLGVAEEKNWTIQIQRPDFYTFEATAETGIFRFKDDISVKMYNSPRCPTPKHSRCSSTAIEVRSRSRIGKSDFGRNAARIENFRARIRALTVETEY